MKSSQQSAKSSLTPSNSKTKKSPKEKRKSSSNAESNHSSSFDKGSPSKDSTECQFAGINAESIKVYDEQCTFENIGREECREACNILAEDINYKLRYIIQDALTKARISGRSCINSTDISETFKNLGIESVYGAPSYPNWVPFGDQNYLCLDDPKVNLVKLAEEENAYAQPAEPKITKEWLPDEEEPNETLKKFFTVLCKSVVSGDVDLRNEALELISTNAQLGPIMDWFYNYSYFLLSKDITYDSFTVYALNLIETLENSPLGSMNVDGKQLKLLVRLILQRLLKFSTAAEILRPMCWVLATLCRRVPLKELVFMKIEQKLPELADNFLLPLLMIINCIGAEAVEKMFLPKIYYFFNPKLNEDPLYSYTLLETYYILYKENLIDKNNFALFENIFGPILIMSSRAHPGCFGAENKNVDFVTVKKKLIKYRKKFYPNKVQPSLLNVKQVFEVPEFHLRMKKKIDLFKSQSYGQKKKYVEIGKTSLLLPLFRNKTRTKCCDHTLFSYNL